MIEYFSRWYDRDPILSKSMKILEESDDQEQIRVALNLIKVIIEHNIQNHEFEAVEDIVGAVETGIAKPYNARWYDIDNTVRTAIQMLEKCTPKTQVRVAKEMAKLVVEKMHEDHDVDEDAFVDIEEQPAIDLDLDLDLDAEDEERRRF